MTHSEVTKQMAQQVTEITDTDAIVEKYGGDKSCLIQILLEIQRKKRWLSEDDLRTVAQSLGRPR